MSTSSLRELLTHVDGTADAIKAAAGAMMKHYDRSAGVAVNEWRNALQTAHNYQLLPLLYVCNETIQNSKRNRGNNFLEAFSPVLGQSLVHICRQDPTLTEKVRRTVKIWGDRHVFSIRFVNELLNNLEPFRHGQPAPPVTLEGATFSPTQETPASSQSLSNKDKSEKDDDDSIMNILENENKSDQDADSEDDESDLFAETSGSQKLDIGISIESLAQSTTPSSPKPSMVKRRRSSTGSAGSQQQSSSQGKRRRKSVLSAGNLLDMWNRLTTLKQSYDHAQLTLEKIDASIAKTDASELEHLVGDELQQTYRQNTRYQEEIVSQRRSLYDIAQECRHLEQEAVRYLPWLEKSLKQDDDDILFCDNLEQKLLSFKKIHGDILKARDLRRAEEQKRREEEEERERKRREEEENEKFRKAALAKETEAKPGMVWNPTTREYQALNTDETWRD